MKKTAPAGYTLQEVISLHKQPSDMTPVTLQDLAALEKLALRCPAQWTHRESLLASGVQRLIRELKKDASEEPEKEE